MFNLFKCKHPASKLVVEKREVHEVIDNDFTGVVYHLRCTKCGENITIEYAYLRDGVDGFVNRALKSNKP